MDTLINFFLSDILTRLTSNGFSLAQFVLFALIFIFWKYSFDPLAKSAKEIKAHLDDLNNAAREMQIHLGNGRKGKLDPIHKLNKLSWANSHSPFQLNDMGENLYVSSGMKSILELHKDDLIGKIKLGNPTTGYDVEKCSFNVIEEFVCNNKSIEEDIKNFIYQNPVFEDKEIGTSDIFFVGSIQLRDMYFEKYPETNTADDKENKK